GGRKLARYVLDAVVGRCGCTLGSCQLYPFNQRRVIELLTGFDTGQRSLPRSRCAGLVVTEHKKPQSLREITVLATNIDAADQIGQRSPAARGDIFQALPEGILKADTCLV